MTAHVATISTLVLAKCPDCGEGWIKPDPEGFEGWGVCDACDNSIYILVDMWSRLDPGQRLEWHAAGRSSLLFVVSYRPADVGDVS